MAGHEDDLQLGLGAGLGEDAVDVVLDGAGGDAQLLGDLLAGLALTQALEDLAFWT